MERSNTLIAEAGLDTSIRRCRPNGHGRDDIRPESLMKSARLRKYRVLQLLHQNEVLQLKSDNGWFYKK